MLSTMTKSWYQSKAVWGGIIALLSAIAGAFGYVIDEDTQTSIIDLLFVVGTGVGGLLAIYGRVKAEREIE